MDRMNIFNKFGLILLRLFLGTYLLLSGIEKIQDAGWPDEFRRDLAEWSSQRTPADAPFYQPEGLYRAVRGCAASNVEGLAETVRWGELILGSLILVGLFSPLALLAQVLYSAFLLVLCGHQAAALESAHLSFVFMGLALYFTRAGRYLGIDSFIHERWGESLFGRMIS